MPNDQFIWNFLKKEGFNDYGTAGLMGNLQAESGLLPNNLQNTFNSKLGLSDEDDDENVPDLEEVKEDDTKEEVEEEGEMEEVD